MVNTKMRDEVDVLARGVCYDAVSIGIAVVVGGIVWMIVDGWFGWYGWTLFFFMGFIVPLTGFFAGNAVKGRKRGVVCLYGILCAICVVVCVFNFTVSTISFANNGWFTSQNYGVARVICAFLLILMWLLLAFVYLLHGLRAGRLARALKSMGGTTPTAPAATVVLTAAQTSPRPASFSQLGVAPPVYDDYNAYVVEPTSPRSPRGEKINPGDGEIV